MNEYDIVIVGAGPAGSSAARVAADKGMKTILLEEHPVIGIPAHCDGRLGATRSGLTDELLETMDKSVVVTELRACRIFAPSGQIVKEIPHPEATSLKLLA